MRVPEIQPNLAVKISVQHKELTMLIFTVTLVRSTRTRKVKRAIKRLQGDSVC